MDKEQINQTPQTKIDKLSLDDLIKKYPNITVQEAMDMGYSYEEILYN
jgi:hypothetical protein